MQPKARKRLARQKPPRNDTAITIRIPHELHHAILRRAKPARMSLNGQIVRLLEYAITVPEH